MAKTSLTRDSMLSHRLKTQVVETPGYPDVYLRTLSKAELALAVKLGDAKDKELNVTASSTSFMIAAALVDEKGQRIFGEGHELEVSGLDYPWFRSIDKKFDEIHFPKPTIEQVAQDAKN